MNKNSLILMVLILAALGAGVLWLQRDVSKPRAEDPLQSLDYASLKRITRLDSESGAVLWSLERDGDRIAVRYADRGPYRGSSELWSSAVTLIDDSRPVEDLPASEIDLAEWGLLPPELRLEFEDDAGVHRVDVSRADLDDGVLYRKAGADALFRVSRRVFTDFKRPEAAYRDPSFSSIPLAELVELRIERHGIPQRDDLVAMRRGDRWSFSRGGREMRGDSLLAEQLGAAFAHAQARPLSKDQRDQTWRPFAKVQIKSREGKTSSYEIVAIDQPTVRLAARSEGEEDLRGVEPRLMAWLMRPVEDFRDRAFIGFGEKELDEIEVRDLVNSDGIKLRKSDQSFWFVGKGRVVPRVDRNRFESFRDRVLTAESIERRPDEPQDFSVRWELRLSFAAEQTTPDLRLEIGAPLADGGAWARRSDEAGFGRLKPEFVEALSSKSWDLMQRHVSSASTEEISALTLKPHGKNPLTAERQDEGWRVSPTHSVSDAVIEPVLGRLQFIAVENYLGRLSPERQEELFREPLWTLKWQQKELRDENGAPLVPEEKMLEVGALVDDSQRACRINLYPGLVFTLRGADLVSLTSGYEALTPPELREGKSNKPR